jgi:predicted porin
MKKSLVALAALAAIAGSAQAQSTVTLYGLVDANVGSFTTNVVSGTAIKSQSQTRINPEGLNGNRWGLRGSEDLGGGLSAIFNLESGFTIDDGAQAQSTLFGRRANVGFAGTFGKVELGRSSSAYNDVAYDHAMMGGASKFDPSNANNSILANTATAGASAVSTNVTGAVQFLGRTTTWLGFQERINNSIKYTSPNMSGFTAAVMLGLGEDKAAGVDASKTVAASVKYANGPLLVSAGYQSEGQGASLTGSAAKGATAPALQNTIVSAAYDFGVAKVGLGLNRALYKEVTIANAIGDQAAGSAFAAQKEYNLSVAVPMGATTLSAGYAVSNGDTLGKSTGFGVQALYALSKRTTLYAGAVSTAAYAKLADAVNANVVGSDVQRNKTYAAGVRHSF